MDWMATSDAAPELSAPANQSQMAIVAREELPALLEALLLVSPEPAELGDLADAAGVSISAVEEALSTLNDDPARGWVVIQHRGTVHIS
jgi:chromosome segregation and condensation protein ScpB